jgi:uncharacterized membrane protein
MAGFFFAFSICVMRALGRLPAEQSIAAMQSINVVVLNPWFFTAFFGTVAACLFLGIAAILNWREPGAVYLPTGSLLYLVGSIMITMAFKVPLNNALAAITPNSPGGAELWTRYLGDWTAWNHVQDERYVTAGRHSGAGDPRQQGHRLPGSAATGARRPDRGHWRATGRGEKPRSGRLIP